MTNLDSILKSRDITLPTNVCLVKAMVFPVVMYGCESCSMKKAEHQRIDTVELWCWRRLLRVPWTARRSNQSVLKEISPEYSLEGLMLKLKLQYLATWCKELTHLKRPWFWKRLKAGEGDHRGWGCWMASPTRWTWDWASYRSWLWTGKPGMLQSMGSQRVGHDWVTELNWKILGFPCGSAGKESACNAGDLDSIPGWGRSPGEGKGYPPQYSGLENSMDCIVNGVAKSRTRLIFTSQSFWEVISSVFFCLRTLVILAGLTMWFRVRADCARKTANVM